MSGSSADGSPTGEDSADANTVAWRDLLAETMSRLTAGGVVDAEISARRIIEEASGFDGAELGPNLHTLATVRGVAHLDSMVTRRLAGEPLQYVVGRWGFRHLDLMVDGRVLIPRPETEEVVGWAIAELTAMRAAASASGDPERSFTAVDLGTGSGAIGLSILAEVDDVDVWLTDRSADALAVARANLVGLSRRAARGRVAEGSWFDALPDELANSIDLIVSNPPYIAAAETLPAEVVEWEPNGALVAGESGDEDLLHLVGESSRWLTPTGVLVMELAPSQAERIAQVAASSFSDVAIRTDLSDRQRAVIARQPIL